MSLCKNATGVKHTKSMQPAVETVIKISEFCVSFSLVTRSRDPDVLDLDRLQN